MTDSLLRVQLLQDLQRSTHAAIQDLQHQNPAAQSALLELDSQLRQFFDSLSAPEAVTPEELTILKDVGAQLQRAKTLAEAQRLHILKELKGLRASRSGIRAYRAADATH